jgi:hypothetical protein
LPLGAAALCSSRDASDRVSPCWFARAAADGEALAISVPAGETRVLKHFQERMPYGLFVPDVS